VKFDCITAIRSDFYQPDDAFKAVLIRYATNHFKWGDVRHQNNNEYQTMTRKEFMMRVGVSTMAIPVCFGMLEGCSSQNPVPVPTNVDFTLDVSTGNLSKDGGYLVKSGVLVARISSREFIAVSAACTHEGTTVQYNSGRNDLECPSHGATFDNSGKVTKGPARNNLAQYQTSLSGNSLRVFS